MKIVEIQKETMKSPDQSINHKNQQNQLNSMKFDEGPQRERSQPGIEQGFCRGSKSYHAVVNIHTPGPLRIHENHGDPNKCKQENQES